MPEQTRYVNKVRLGEWTDAANAFADDGLCTSTKTKNAINRYDFTNDPFTIPSGATITGLLVRTRWGGDGNDTWECRLVDALGKDCGLSGKPSVHVCADAVLASGGGDGNLLGGTWTPAYINSGDFVCWMRYVPKGKAGTMYIDFVYVTVYYTEPATGILSVDTTPVKGEVFVEEESWGTAPQSRELVVGFYTVSFGDIPGSVTPDPVETEVKVDETTYIEEVYTEAWYCTLNGTIEATEENCDRRGFDWGTAPDTYPFDWTEVGSFGVGSFSHQITGLDLGKTYYFRAKARNAGGWGYGEEKTAYFGVVFVETITAKRFPMHYLSKPAKAQELISKVEGATITHTVKDFPETLLKKGKAQELRSKWEPPQ